MNQKTWHEQSWDDFVSEFTPTTEKTYLVVARSTFEHVYMVEASSAEEASRRINDDECMCSFYQKHIGEVVIRVAETPLDSHEIHETLTENGYI